ncbi:hypothetical protein HOB10_00180 [Candidatus Parcubacteria bacterium]|jgi:inhibitor of cysteine peptidase|nr:hypothetical protein [Candidatus Parcubacteria bacterium]
MKKKTTKKKNKNFFGNFGSASLSIILLIIVFAVSLSLIIRNSYQPGGNNTIKEIFNPVKNVFQQNSSDIKAFESEEEFKNYLALTDDLMLGSGMMNSRAVMEAAPSVDDWGVSDMQAVNLGAKSTSFGGGVDRYSETNVQVVGIDEPDIVKTDGEEIYFSRQGGYYPMDTPIFIEVDGMVRGMPGDPSPNYMAPKTNIINAWPPADLELEATIDETGNMLLHEDTLVIFSGKNIVAYDVSDPSAPDKKWSTKLEDDTYLVTARLYDDKIYLVTRNRINRYSPCPISPLTDVNIGCVDIYHPHKPLPVDSTFVSMSLEVDSGEVKDTISFIGSSYASVVYMSADSLYITYQNDASYFDIAMGFFREGSKDLMPVSIYQRLEKISSYDISNESKMMEMGILVEEWLGSLDNDEALRIENEMENRMTDYFDNHKRDFFATEIVRIDIDDLDIKANGLVPGHPLNQFSLDEYEGHLRIATTVGDTGGFSSQENANDVYVLNKDMKITGEVIDMGLTEKIYSARFVQDKGYLVTFRRTDPFYVLDLSDPKNPKKTGELKIPGYSSYLHPITKDKILGIGKEGGNVKISYFDVSDPSDPKEIDKYTLSDYSSDVLYDHHAFLLDTKHEIFFMPGGKGGYVFSYEDDKIKMVKAIDKYNVERALYLNDYLYVISYEGIVVLNENDWEEVNDFELEN